jgi:hypothetical protein
MLRDKRQKGEPGGCRPEIERKVLFLDGRVEPSMLTVRFSAYPVYKFEPNEDETTAFEQVDHTDRVIPDLEQTYRGWNELRSAFDEFLQRAEITGRPAIVSAAAVEKRGERKFFGFNRWEKSQWRLNYARIRENS